MADDKKIASGLHLAQSDIAQYILAGVFVGLVLTGCFKYTQLIGEAQGLTLLNRTMSSGTIFLLSAVLLIGPMNRLFGGIWRTLFILRKEIGMYTFLAGFVHVYLSMFPLARRGPWGFYESRPWSAYPGLAALLLMAILFFFSFVRTQKMLPSSLWWKLQYTGARIALLGLVVHTVVLRWNAWGTWLGQWWKGETIYPPLAFLAVVFALYVTKVKLAERWSGVSARNYVIAASFFLVIFVTFLFVFPSLR